LLAAYGSVLAAVIVLFGAALFWGMNTSFNEKMHSVLHSIVLDIRHDILKGDPHPVDAGERYAVSPVFIEIWEADGPTFRRTHFSPNMRLHRFPVMKDKGDVFALRRLPFVSTTDESAYVTERFDANGKRYIVAAATPIDGADDMLEAFLFWFALGGTLFYLLAFWLGLHLINTILLPMKSITSTAENIAQHDLSQRVPLSKQHDEFYELAATFNAMLDRLEAAFMRMKRFNANVSHELKTPLTIIRGEAEVALLKSRDSAAYERVLRSIMQESESMQRIIDVMLLLSTQNSEAIEQRMQPVRLDALLLDSCQKLRALADAKKITIEIVRTEPVTITAEPQLLEEAFINLLDNAVKYSPNGQSVRVDMHASKNSVTVTIADEGKGIDPVDIPKMFEPFWREEDAHSKQIPGNGLGLALVRWILQAHHASIEIESEKGEGTLCRLYFKI
jgi:heavy metal sensor kinase